MHHTTQMFKQFEPSEPSKRKWEDRDACSSPNIDIVTSDQVHFCVTKKIAEQMGILKDLLDNDYDNQFPLPRVNAATFEKIMEYCSYVARGEGQAIELSDPLIRFKPRDTVEVSYMSADMINTTPSIFNLLQAADYLDIPRLVDLCSANICTNILESSLRSLRRDFHIDQQSPYFEWTQRDIHMLQGRNDI